MFKKRGLRPTQEFDIEQLNVGSIVSIEVEQSEVLRRLKGIENKMASIEQELVEANKKSTD